MTRLNEIRERLEAATPGPWDLSYHASNHKPSGIMADKDNPEWIPNGGAGGYAVTIREPGDEQAFIDWHGNGAFIAHAPADIAWLLEAVEKADLLILGQVWPTKRDEYINAYRAHIAEQPDAKADNSTKEG